jgi:adenylosuccinate synthase
LVNLILILSGPIASGKSNLSRDLSERFGFAVLKTNELLKELAQSESEETRKSLQTFGRALDLSTNGAWVRDGLIKFAENLPDDAKVIVDSARIAEQIEAIRSAFGLRVLHVHLTAPPEILERRFNKRKKKRFKENLSYAQVKKDPTERQVETLRAIADVVIDTKRSSEQDVVVRVASHLGLFGREYSRLVDVVVGGEYGSEGKGHIASYLSREYDILIRVGGPNAGHKVISPPYTFRQLPSGTSASEAKLIIGPGAVINVAVLMQEIGDCEVDANRLTIDPQAMVIELADIDAEGGLVDAISSTGQGVGFATARRIIGRGGYAGQSELERQTPPKRRIRRIDHIPVRLAGDIKEIKPFVRPAYEELEKAFSRGDKILLEGTQGTALSIFHGMYPHVTSRDTTVTGCLAEAGISPNRVRKVVMVCRTYPIRVGDAPNTGNTSGPMAQEISLAEISRRSGVDLKELRKTERGSVTKKRRRISEFDWSLIRRAASLNAPTDIALSFVDYINVKNKDARRFDQLTEETIRFIEEVERVTTAPVSLISTRFHPRSIIDRRSW